MSEGLFSEVFLPATLVVIMTGVGLSLTLQSFKSIIIFPKAIITGLFAQMGLLPIIAFVLADRMNIAPEYKVGLVIIAASPGGASSGLVNHLLRANVALSVSLTTINSLLVVFTMPYLTGIALERYMGDDLSISLPFARTVGDIALKTVAPVLLGVLIRRFHPAISRRLELPLRYILPILLLLAFLGVIFFDAGGGSDSYASAMSLVKPVLLLNAISMGLGYLLTRLMGLGSTSGVTISTEVGLQNSSLAIYVAHGLIKSWPMALVGVVYGTLTFASTILMALFIKWLNLQIRRLNRWFRVRTVRQQADLPPSDRSGDDESTK
jgi:BASS family bile acid:Na+ symporter